MRQTSSFFIRLPLQNPMRTTFCPLFFGMGLSFVLTFFSYRFSFRLLEAERATIYFHLANTDTTTTKSRKEPWSNDTSFRVQDLGKPASTVILTNDKNSESSIHPDNSGGTLSSSQIVNRSVTTQTRNTFVETSNNVKTKKEKNRFHIPVGNQLKVNKPIFVLSLPKSGTTSLYRYFNCGRVPSAHTYGKNYTTGKSFRLGTCMHKNFHHGRPIVHACGHLDMYSDVGVIYKPRERPSWSPFSKCFYPSLQAVHAIARDYPNATIIVSYRHGWYESMQQFNGLASRLRRDCPSFPNTTQADVWEDFYRQHRQGIRDVVKQSYPTLRYLEFDVKDPMAGVQLEEFTGISHQCWGDCKPDLKCDFFNAQETR